MGSSLSTCSCRMAALQSRQFPNNMVKRKWAISWFWYQVTAVCLHRASKDGWADMKTYFLNAEEDSSPSFIVWTQHWRHRGREFQGQLDRICGAVDRWSNTICNEFSTDRKGRKGNSVITRACKLLRDCMSEIACKDMSIQAITFQLQ